MTAPLALPPGACDSHLHVFGPYETFPLAAERSYEPPYAPFERLIAMLDAHALDRAVLVQPSAYGADHSALLDALRRAPQRLRGIAVLQPQDAQALSDAALDAMHAAGVRGLRFTDASAAAFKGNVGIEALPALASRMRQRGWHAQVWMGCRALLEAMPLLQAAQLPVVVDHMGRFDAQAGINGADFVELCAALADGGAQGWLWVKLSLCRATPDFPDYAQARPFHDALVRANPQRLLWASDWPHIRMAEKTPDVGHLLHVLSQWLDDAALQQRILVDNPALLYGFPAV